MKKNIAILIDGDNAQAKYVHNIIKETSKYGRITIKRIYGNFTNNSMKSWNEKLSTYSIKPMQNNINSSGKNATDISLVIDAMDILHNKNIDIFCIVSSDSDFTALANRIKENTLKVIGIGKKQSLKSFINACDIFIFTDDFERKTPLLKKIKLDIMLIRKVISIVKQKNSEALLSQIALTIKQSDPNFDTKTYGFKNFNSLFKSLKNEFELIYHKDTTTISVKDKSL